MRSLIYGYGITGKSFERYLINNGKLEYDIFDQNIPEFNKRYDLSSYDQILCSPGISPEKFYTLNNLYNVKTDVDIFFNEDKSKKIGITGTNGKSTTCFHLSQLLNQDYEVNLVGNIGSPVLDVINNGKEYSIIELSSFQLHKMKENKLDFGVLINIQPDHLDYHKNFEDYKLAKEKILLAKQVTKISDPYHLYKWISGKNSKSIKLRNLPYRYEFISSTVINDSKSTNSSSLLYAIEKANDLFDQDDYYLICCGDPKKENYPEVNISGPVEILIYGKHHKEINSCLKHKNKKIFNDIKSLYKYLEANAIKSNILFSPGFPSGLDYRNFEERGNDFNKSFLNLSQ